MTDKLNFTLHSGSDVSRHRCIKSAYIFTVDFRHGDGSVVVNIVLRGEMIASHILVGSIRQGIAFCQSIYDLKIGTNEVAEVSKPESQPAIRAEDILKEADKITSGDRRRDYGHPSENFKRIADGFNWFFSMVGINAIVQPWMIGPLMIIMKIARHTRTKKTRQPS